MCVCVRVCVCGEGGGRGGGADTRLKSRGLIPYQVYPFSTNNMSFTYIIEFLGIVLLFLGLLITGVMQL